MRKEYKDLLRQETKIKEDFHSNGDFYNSIRQMAIKLEKLDIFDEVEIKAIINNSIESNFGGIDYEIDISFDLILMDIERDIETIRDIFREEISDMSCERKPTRRQKISSV